MFVEREATYMESQTLVQETLKRLKKFTKVSDSIQDLKAQYSKSHDVLSELLKGEGGRSKGWRVARGLLNRHRTKEDVADGWDLQGPDDGEGETVMWLYRRVVLGFSPLLGVMLCGCIYFNGLDVNLKKIYWRITVTEHMETATPMPTRMKGMPKSVVQKGSSTWKVKIHSENVSLCVIGLKSTVSHLAYQ